MLMNSHLLIQLEELGLNDLGQLYKAVYKSTPCGPAMVATMHGIPFYNEDLRQITRKHLLSCLVTSLEVSSIVEGVEAEVGPIAVTDDLWAVVDTVDRAANDIWNQTHGCAGECAQEFNRREGRMPDDFEHWPVWSECEDCGGHGEVL